MLRGSPQSEIDRHAYIPPDVKNALNQHFSQNVPAHLQQYIGANNSGYVPRGMEQAITREMQRNLPKHLQQYADAYVQQNVISPTIQSRSSGPSGMVSSSELPSRPPTPNVLRRDHSMPSGEQHTVELNTLPEASKEMFESNQVGTPSAPTPTSGNPYDFILQPEQKSTKKSPMSFSGLSPDKSRILIVLAGLLLLLIIFAVLKGLLSGGSNTASLISVAQDQTEIIHLSQSAAQQQYVNQANLTLVSTMQIAVSSSRQQLISYLATNGHKINVKKLILKENKSTDTDLANAQSSGNYNPALDQVLQSQLHSYINDLSTAYNLTKGSKGRALIKSSYAQAKLFQTQLNAINNPAG